MGVSSVYDGFDKFVCLSEGRELVKLEVIMCRCLMPTSIVRQIQCNIHSNYMFICTKSVRLFWMILSCWPHYDLAFVFGISLTTCSSFIKNQFSSNCLMISGKKSGVSINLYR